MNYAALSIDELAARCAVDAKARQYAGDHFAELVVTLEDEWRDQLAGDPYFEPEPFPWLDDTIPLEWWTIG